MLGPGLQSRGADNRPRVPLPVQQPWFFGEHPRGGRPSAGVPSATLPVLFTLRACEALARCEARVCCTWAAEEMGSSWTATQLKMPSLVAFPVLAGDPGWQLPAWKDGLPASPGRAQADVGGRQTPAALRVSTLRDGARPCNVLPEPPLPLRLQTAGADGGGAGQGWVKVRVVLPTANAPLGLPHLLRF